MKFVKREIPKSEGGLFLSLKDGESISGVPRGEVFEFFQVWENRRSRVVNKGEPGAKSRFRVNIVVKEDGKLVAKIWEFGLVIYNQLADMAEEYDLSKTKLKITRRGVDTDTVYMILPLLKEPIPAATLKEIEAIDLNILEHKDTPKTDDDGPEPNF